MPKQLPGHNADLSALLPFASVRLIAADLDGTLYPSEVLVTAQRLLRQLGRIGVRFTLATGRTMEGVRALRAKFRETDRSLLRKGTPLILYNGSVIAEAETGEILNRSLISSSALTEVLEVASLHDCEVLAYCCDQLVLQADGTRDADEKVFGWVFGGSRARYEREFNGSTVSWQENALARNVAPSAILIRASGSDSYSKLWEDVTRIEGVSVTRSGSNYLELRPAGSNKGVALLWAAQHLGLSADKVLAIGDNDNDAEMLAWAGIGVSISTASAVAKESSDYQCGLGPFQGVIEVLRLVHQAHRLFRAE